MLLFAGPSRWSLVADMLSLLWLTVNDHRWPIAQVGLVDQDRSPVLLLQDAANHAEVRCRLPARLQLAATGHTVALAPDLHIIGHGPSAGPIVVAINLRLDVDALFAGIEKQLGKLDPKRHVVRAATPLPPARLFRLHLPQTVTLLEHAVALGNGVEEA
uniref:Putative secreted protein n=1 Tax=Anopheles darlingi TaxID=43151 RepID=A0A2M4D5G0_ANODA